MTDLMAEMAALLDLSQSFFWVAVLVFVRVGAVVSLLPALGEQAVPQRVKLSFVLAFTAVVAPVVAEGPLAGIAEPGFAALGVEVVAGLILGIGLRMFVLVLQTAASIIAQATTLSQLFAGAAPEPQPAIGNLFIVAGLALAVNAGLHVRAAELMILSYDILPQGTLPDPADVADWGLSLVAATFSLSFSLAAPFVIASMIYNLALGAINRAMPQLMVSFVGAPALTLGALAMLMIATPMLLAVWLQAFGAHLAAPFMVPP
ncbi:flagellar biosynthetic protein FliR [Tabrizicola sp.]|uniref:flagellar biosynthetic protein FliR n=1 Tax=Tabrizicola sp. TaxID=2005166 RepID=UPI00286C97DD|nr:flagellar biosynthetic protein FliR [Tabrizicola sp.]